MVEGCGDRATQPGKFRKLPVVVQAWQHDGSQCRAVDLARWIGSKGEAARQPWGPDWLVYVDTLEGRMMADPGDWIIRGVQGEFYPCKPDIFEATYESWDFALPESSS